MSSEEYLSVEPSQITFTLPDLGFCGFCGLRKEVSSCPLKLLNNTEHYIAFKVKTTNSNKYRVRPNPGVVLPRSTLDVSVKMQASSFTTDMQCNDKFLLQSAITVSGDIDLYVFNKEVQGRELKVAYVSPSQHSSSILEGLDEGPSPSTPVPDDGYSNTSDLTSNAKADMEPKKQSSEVCNASSEIMGSPSKVGEQEKMGESSHLNIRRKTNVEVMKKVKDMKILKEKGISTNGTFINDLEKATPKRFSHEELKKVTSDFATKVGSGGFGDVYKGQFLDGTEVAVKVLRVNNFDERIFEAEVFVMFKTAHRNVVKFYGYCFDDDMKALVSEYMRNGSLDEVLYKNHLSLEWERLYKISIEIAIGLSYLHDGCNDKIIHHDIKAPNVLLDSDLSPKITDFGLARLISRSVSHITWTGMRGTKGYMAPEMFIPSSEITHKCDVYSFGMMMFEVLGMRRNGEGLKWFPKKVWSKFNKGELDEIIDDCGIHTEKDKANAKILSKVALWCIQHTPLARPNMSSVVKMLEGEIPVKEPPNPFLPVTELFY